MTLRKTTPLRSALSLFLSALILALSPGLVSYSAFAATLDSSSGGESLNLAGAGQGASNISGEDFSPLGDVSEGVKPGDEINGLGEEPAAFEASDSGQSKDDGQAEPRAEKPEALPAKAGDHAPSLRQQLTAGGAALVRADEGSKPRLLSRLFGENSKLSSLKNLIFGGGRTPAHASGLQPAAYLGDDAVLKQKVIETPLVFMDYETMGLIAEVNPPIDLGVIKEKLRADGTFEVMDTFDQLINPAGFPLDQFITELTGITPGDLKGQPGYKDVFGRFAKTIPSNAVLFAHNAPFEGAMTGFWTKKTGIEAPRHMLLDTRLIAKALYPDLKSYAMRDLINQFGIGDVEAHRGLADSIQEGLLFAKLMPKLAENLKVKVEDLTIGDVAKLSPPIHFDTFQERMQPKPVASLAQKTMPAQADLYGAYDSVAKALHKERKPDLFRDVAYEMGLDYNVLLKAMTEVYQHVKTSKADEILDAIAKRAEEAAKAGKQFMVVFDIDKTLTENGANGLSTGIPQDTLDAIVGLLKRGVPVGILTSRSYDSQPSDTTIPMTAKEILFDKIPAGLRSGITFAGLAGGELVRFDRAGTAERDLKGDWTDEEKGVIDSSIKAAMAAMNLTENDLKAFIHPRAQVDVVFKQDAQNPNNFAQAAAFAHKLNDEVRARNFPYQVIQGGSWVYINKYNKGAGIRNILISLRGQGQAVSEETMLYVADEFNDAPGRPAGGDVAAASGLPDANFINVGGLASEPLPANVQQITVKGPRAVVRIIAAINQGLDAAGRSAATPLLSRRPVQLALAALTGAALALVAVHAAWWAPVSAGAFLILGFPQLWTNKVMKFEGVKDLSLGFPLIWFGVAGLLAAFYLTSQPIVLAYVVSNLFNAAQAIVLAWQKNHWDPKSGAWMMTVLAMAPVAAVLVATWLAPAMMVATGLAKLIFPVAMGLLAIINVSQVDQNYQLFQEKGIVPQGVNPGWPALVLLGSALQTMSGFHAGILTALGMSMVLNGLLSVFWMSIVMAQLFEVSAPWTNRMISPVFGRLTHKASKKS